MLSCVVTAVCGVFGTGVPADQAQPVPERAEVGPDAGPPGLPNAGQPGDRAASAAAEGVAPALTTLERDGQRSEQYASRSKAWATIKAYAAGWRDFMQFCEVRELTVLPASEQTVADYLAYLADNGYKAATIATRLVMLSQAHKAVNLSSPTTASLVRRTHAGIRRTIGTAQRGKAPALSTDLKRMLSKLPNTPVGMRDRALMLLGFAGGFRRSELVGLNFEDLEFSTVGLRLRCAAPRTTRRPRGAASASRTARQRRPARYGQSRTGSTWPASPMARSSGPWTNSSACSRAGSLTKRSRELSNAAPRRLGWIPIGTPATRSGLDWPPAQRPAVPRSGRSGPRPAIAPTKWSGAIFARRTCLPLTTRLVWLVCDPDRGAPYCGG